MILLKNKRTSQFVALHSELLIAILPVIFFFCTIPIANAETYFVDQNHLLANDDNPGTEGEPFETVQQGLNTALAFDTVFVKDGVYNLSGYSKIFTEPISIIGENKNTTVLDSIGSLQITASDYSDVFNLRNIRFTNFMGTIINFSVDYGGHLDGVYISDCIFDEVERTSKTRIIQGRYEVSPNGAVSNIYISNCDFLGLTAPGVKCIYLYEGILSNITITNNNFYNLISNSETRGVVAINVGTNSNLFFNKNILISGNFIDTLVASSVGEIETHGILAYGDSMQIVNNTVREMNPGTDHEGIYMKGSHSLIANNVMINSTSHHGAIAIKGAGKSFNDTIRGNRVQSTQSGRGIYTAGPEYVLMEDNYVKCTSEESTNGLYIYAANETPCFMTNNYAQTAGASAYLHDVVNGGITGNTLISYNSIPIKLAGSSEDIIISGNSEYSGWPFDPPTALASADIIEGEIPFTANFSSAGSFDPDGEILTYEWNFHDGTTSNETNPTHTFTTSRTYTVTLIVTDADGFKDMSYIVIQTKKDEIYVDIESSTIAHEDMALTVFPNPFSSHTKIKLQLKSELPIKMQILDMQGTIVNDMYNGKLPSGEHQMIWDGTNSFGKNVAAGLYLLRCNSVNFSQTTKVLLLK